VQRRLVRAFTATALAAALLAAPGAQAFQLNNGGGSGSLLLGPADLPGYTAQPASIMSLTDAHDYGPDQAFVDCSAGVPLLGQFDNGNTGVQIGPFYGTGHNPFGTPQFAIASVVFDDGSATDAEQALSALSNSSFQDCWAATQDKLNKQQGITVPTEPSTVASLSVPSYGDGTAAFSVNEQYDVLGRTVDGIESVVALRQGATLVMLVTVSYGASFPDSVLDSALGNIAQRAAAGRHQLEPTTGHGPCVAPVPAGGPPLLASDQVSAAVGTSLTYKGWTNTPASTSGGVASYECAWKGPRVNGGPYYHGVEVYLTISGPFPIGGAKAALTQQAKGWGTMVFQSSLGQPAIWIPMQDGYQALEVQSGNALVTVSMSVRTASQLSANQTAEDLLAADVLGVLGTLGGNGATGGSGATGSSGSSGASGASATCHGPGLANGLNSALQRALFNEVPVTLGEIDLPGPLFVDFAPLIQLYHFQLCVAGLTTSLLQRPSQTSESFSFTASPSGGGTIDGESTLGPFSYDGGLAAWTSVDRNATPSGQVYAAQWSPSWSWHAGINAGVAVGRSLKLPLTIGTLYLTSRQPTLTLVRGRDASLAASWGPRILINVQVTNQSLTQDLGDDLAGGESETKAVDALSESVSEDLGATVQAEAESQVGAPLPQVEDIVNSLDASIKPYMRDWFNRWFDSIAPDSPVAEALDAQDATLEDIPSGAAAALEETATPVLTFEDALEFCLEGDCF
jgi:hypothetical protein